VSETIFLSQLYINANVLPRQAQDKHEESTQKEGDHFSLRDGPTKAEIEACLAQAAEAYESVRLQGEQREAEKREDKARKAAAAAAIEDDSSSSSRRDE
jgi:hypothetical protein